MKNILYLLLICSLFISSCRKKKLNGTVSIYGVVKDSYTNLPVANQRVAIGQFSSSWAGGRRFDISTTMLTDSNGNYSLSHSVSSKSAVFVALVDSANTYFAKQGLNQTYYFKSIDYNSHDEWILYNATFAESNNEKVAFYFSLYSRLKVNLKHNPTIAKDSITFIGNDYRSLNVINDTTLFLKLIPNTKNNVKIKRANVENVVYEENYDTSLAGDTTVRNIQL